MKTPQRGRYSKYLRPISFTIDILIVLILSTWFLQGLNVNFYIFHPYQIIAWTITAYFVGFYKVYRFTSPVQILSKLFIQGIIFLLLTISFFPFAKETIFSGKLIATYLPISFILIAAFKFLLFYYLKRYRIITGSNQRNAIIVGYNEQSIKLKELFETRKDYGYKFYGFFAQNINNEQIKGTIDQVEQFCLDNKIDDIYCSLNDLSNKQVKTLVQFADQHNKVVKFIPDSKEILTKNLRIDYYEFFPVLSLTKTPLHEIEVKMFKRLFDVIFSSLVIIFVLSWLTPLLGLLIKIESRGPIFFKQGRPGLNEKEFFCYKFRSMYVNKNTESETFKNDPRVTRIGKFLRKTSLDELPQFINVLKGEMSVVGPRPHLWAQNVTYGKKIKKYMFRLYVKPGVTGLAQVRGYRGEIETDTDMINRIKYDVFYIENWSFLLDIKIIIQTVVNIFKGDEKAY